MTRLATSEGKQEEDEKPVERQAERCEHEAARSTYAKARCRVAVWIYNGSKTKKILTAGDSESSGAYQSGARWWRLGLHSGHDKPRRKHGHTVCHHWE
jgi:hypothetical protein